MRVRGRRGVTFAVDERQAEVLNRAINGTHSVERKPDFWDRFDAATDWVLDFMLDRVFWIIGGLTGALVAIAVAAQLLGWTSS